ncbi:phosphoenolpyruvate carboxykinase (ATP) [Candidatus Wirthbacteria bacterium CG2_30_54_11]|uniref:phosphoenolpyruvate carboxykinase (ATP) n=1 Tax=Candidatus Wirthbacteria bacterium CG2_30_54_11 TaxID=1817892 RepID=A0A1J5IMH0_9BACT|nr:MAG: phosphoenolpyruvate carboxykinase (ATP) [Candidatus Wirthbacteria bacterium CG2_30_54_11]
MYKEYIDRRLQESAKIEKNPSVVDLRAMAKHHEKTSKHGHPVYESKIRSRSAKHTYHVNDDLLLGRAQKGITGEEAKLLYSRVLDQLEDQEMILIDRQMGVHPSVHYHCRMYVPKAYARLAYMWSQMLFEEDHAGEGVDFLTLYVPEWEETKIIVDPREGLTLVLGTDYFGEAKKAFLRKAMYDFKTTRGGLGFHAGSKQLDIAGPEGRKEVGFILFGLSGTGKTTLTMHDHGLTGEERVHIKQDDVVLMDDTGYCYGTERGFFIKTEGLDESQEVLYRAAMDPDSIFENVHLEEDGGINFSDSVLTSNGRGIMVREKVRHTDTPVDLARAHNIIFITRRDDIVPPLARLTPEQGAAFFMLGESIETSAGDPTKAGQSKREVGTNPFLIGREEDEGNRFLEILRANSDITCYTLNTGSIGKKTGQAGKKIGVALSTGLLKRIAYGDIEWERDADWGYDVPKTVPGFDMKQWDPRSYYTTEEYAWLVDSLRSERLLWLAQFPDLLPEIVQAIA